MAENIQATPDPAAPRRPDAVRIPRDHRLPPETGVPRFHALFDLAERLLGADPTRGERAHRVTMVNEGQFVYSLDPGFTLLHRHDGILAGRPRYHWVAQPDGTAFGYLTDDARAVLAAGR